MILFVLLRKTFKWLTTKDLFRIRCQIDNRGKLRLQKYVDGQKNKLVVGERSVLKDVRILISGNSNTIIIGDDCYLGNNCSIRAEGNNINVSIGNKCTFTHDTELCAQEDGSEIRIGDDCMFSHHINIRTSDSHLIYDIKSGNRINFPKSVFVGNHVWVAPNVIIMKGVNIGDGSIIGSNAIVTKNVQSCQLAAGIPAKVVKQDVSWSREKLF